MVEALQVDLKNECKILAISETYLIPLHPLLSKGGNPAKRGTPSFGKACLPVGRGGREGFSKVISNS
jgi:hypothetical protein